MGYDAAGRRVTKAINGTSMDDCTYHYYLSGNSVVEERNGSDQPIKDHVRGLTYVDEAVQTRVNTNLSTPSWSGYYHLQDANFNELGVVNASGNLVERYEYAAYGQRQVFTSAGSNDPGCYAPVFASRKVVINSISQPWGLNDVGHQGLLHDEQTGLIANRARMIQPQLGRFLQQDPLGFPDGLNCVLVERSNPQNRLDPLGLRAVDPIPAGDFAKLPKSPPNYTDTLTISNEFKWGIFGIVVDAGLIKDRVHYSWALAGQASGDNCCGSEDIILDLSYSNSVGIKIEDSLRVTKTL
jgi:RHS repeat-associated protein